MGEQEVRAAARSDARRRLTLDLLEDLDALEQMIDAGAIERGVRRLGAEQELFLVDAGWRPAPLALHVLERLEGSQFTTELGRFNLEINLDPVTFRDRCLTALHEALERDLGRVRAAAAEVGAQVALSGTLPTLRKSDLSLENMTPRPRYKALNEAMNAQRGGPWRLHIRGLEELASKHDNVMLEACCTSFQVHLQVAPEEFAFAYNVAQAITAPLLAAAANSPTLFGQRLWHETRIPVFQQSIDTRRMGESVREAAPRVRFGESWLDDSILELFREDVVRFRILLDREIETGPLKRLAQGSVPRLQALQLHNGTVYRWNRGCYGVTEGRPHLRIEARALPAGPSSVDEVANAALFVGLVTGWLANGIDVRGRLDFAAARANFLTAAAHGLDARLVWLGGKRITASDLLTEQLLPLARDGLAVAGVDDEDASRFLDIIEERVRSGRNGARWQLDTFERLAGRQSRQQITTALVAGMVENQGGGQPVHRWPPAAPVRGRELNMRELRVEEIMSRDVHTLGPDEPVELAGKMMEWKSIRHLPVEDTAQQLVGMVTVFQVMKALTQSGRVPGRTIESIMTPDPPTVGPDAPLATALEAMREHGVDALPVVKRGQLVGIVTERDFVHLLTRLVE